jgi:hypothetical protein
VSAHTPGPWRADIRTGCYAVYPGEHQNCLDGCGAWAVADQGGRGEESNGPGSYRLITDEQRANARLIAAAPDLLEALKFAEAILSEHVAASCDICGGEGGWTNDPQPRMTPVRHKTGCEYLTVRAAIAKAEADQ